MNIIKIVAVALTIFVICFSSCTHEEKDYRDKWAGEYATITRSYMENNASMIDHTIWEKTIRVYKYVENDSMMVIEDLKNGEPASYLDGTLHNHTYFFKVLEDGTLIDESNYFKFCKFVGNDSLHVEFGKGYHVGYCWYHLDGIKIK